MITEVLLQRELFGEQISQKSKSEFFSATDLVRVGNKWRRGKGMIDFNLSQFLTQKSTIEFISSIDTKYSIKSLSIGRGRAANTWVHPLLFIDIALAISPDLKIEVYEWLFDHLIRVRNSSGDSYKKMCGSLWLNCTDKSRFKEAIEITANLIRNACEVNDWQTANEVQLQKRDRIHENISLLCNVLRDNNKAISIGITQAK